VVLYSVLLVFRCRAGSTLMYHPKAATDRGPMGYIQQLSEARWQRSPLALKTRHGRISRRCRKTLNREREVESISSSAFGILSRLGCAKIDYARRWPDTSQMLARDNVSHVSRRTEPPAGRPAHQCRAVRFTCRL
jgi:hypothetical protein